MQPRRLAYRLSQIGTLSGQLFAARVADLGLTPSQAGTLRLVGRHPGIGQRRLAERLDTAPSRVVVLLDGLESRGLLVRRRSATDRRQHEVALSQEGEALLARLRPVAHAHEAEVVGVLGESDQAHLDRILAILAEHHGIDAEVHPGQAGRP